MYHIFSTMANDNEYVQYSEHGPRGVNIAERSVLIKGGSGVHQKRLGTPLGVHTAVSEENFAWLRENFSFKQHMANGYIRVEKSKLDPEVVAADMKTRDQKTDACPIVPQDFQAGADRETVRPMDGKPKRKAA